MHIVVLFQFNHEGEPAAATGIQGDVTDIILPAVGDIVEHGDSGHSFTGKVTERRFRHDMSTGEDVDGSVMVTLCLDHTTVQ